MRGHNICFNGKIRKITPKLSPLPLLIWSTGVTIVRLDDVLQEAKHRLLNIVDQG